MRFFEKTRVELYFHGGKLFRDGKSGERRWRMNLVVTLKAAEVLACDEVIIRNYEALETRENWIEEIKIAKEVPEHGVEFFGLSDHTAPVLRLSKCTLTDLKMTRVEGASELWVKVEHENTDALHGFVKDYAFHRFWAEFEPIQASLLPKEKKPASIPRPFSARIN